MNEVKEPQPPETEAIHLENGIFSLVVTWYKKLQEELGPQRATTYVAQYLESLAKGIRESAESQQGEK